jgi:hypothetical protein
MKLSGKILIFSIHNLEWSRNIRFALSTDVMNPFRENSTMHSTWPIILTMHNILIGLCHKRKYLMSSILIEGLMQVGIDIDVRTTHRRYGKALE